MLFRLLCGFIYIFVFLEFGFVIAQNCTEAETKSIEKCQLDHLALNSNISTINASTPLFADYKQRRLLLDSYCQNFKAYISCITKIDPNPEPDPDDHSCISTMLQLTEPLNAYVCEMMLTMAKNKTYESCWAATKQCSLTYDKQPQTERNLFCNFFESAEMQINCAMDQQQGACKQVPGDVLRLARSETFNVLDTFSCVDNSEDPGLAENKNEGAIQGGPVTMQNPAEYHPDLQLCTSEQNRNALVCLSEMWGIEKYIAQLKDGKLWLAMMANQTLWQNICQDTGNYQRCMSKVLPAGKPRCQFKTLVHSFASLLNVLCTEENLKGIRAQASCVAKLAPDVAAKYQTCAKKLDELGPDLKAVQNKNDADALCSAFSAPIDTADCMALVFSTSSCQPIINGLQTLMDQVSEEAAHDGCIKTNETSSETSHEVETKSPVQPTVKSGTGVQQGNATESSSDVCPLINANLCSGDSKTFGFHPLTVLTDKERLNSTCSVRTDIKRCLPQLNCMSSAYYSGLSGGFDTVCGETYDWDQELSICLRNIHLFSYIEECTAQFENTTTEIDKCTRVNEFLTCVSQNVRKLCGELRIKYLVKFLGAVAKGANASCVVEIPKMAVTPPSTQITIENVTAAVGTNNEIGLNKDNQSESSQVTESVGFDNTPKCQLVNAIACKGDSSVYGFQPVSVLSEEARFDAMCNNRRDINQCYANMTCTSNIYYTGLQEGYKFSCTKNYPTYLNVTNCLKTIEQTDSMQQCIKDFENQATFANDSCGRMNSLLSCSYPLILKTCGSQAAYFHIDYLGVVARGVDPNCNTPTPSGNTQGNKVSRIPEVNQADNTPTNGTMSKISRIPDANQGSSAQPTNNETVLAHPVNCNPEEEQKIIKCVEPFKVVVHRFEALTSGGLSSLLKGLNNITAMFHEGCGLRGDFENCYKINIGFATECRISSCLMKLGETECVKDPADRSLEEKLRCMFTLVAEPGFKECMKLLPRDSFKDFNKLRVHLPEFFNCLKEPILTKCGQDSWRLVTSLSSSVNPGEADPNCTLTFNQTGDGASTSGHPQTNELGESNKDNSSKIVVVNEKVIPSNTNITMEHKLAKNESLDTDEGNETFIETETNLVTQLPAEMTSIPSSAVVINGSGKAVCSAEKLDKYDDCLNILGDLKPIPVYFYDDRNKIDKVCPLFNKFQTCLESYDCRYPLGEAYKAMLKKLCTTYYDAFKLNQDCLSRIVISKKMQNCIGTFQASNLRSSASDLGDRACKTVGDLLKCVGDAVDFSCIDEAPLNMLYDIYNSFVQQFKPECVHSRDEIGAPMKQCNGDQRKAYFACRQNVTFNPISIVNDTKDFPDLCSTFSTDFQSCVGNLSCLPQPAHQAFNDTMSRICYPETSTGEYKNYGQCLTQVATKPNAQQCVKAFNDIVVDDIGKMVCRKVNSVMDCQVPLILEQCGTTSLAYINNIMSYFMIRYRSGCTLNVPQLSTTRNPSGSLGNVSNAFKIEGVTTRLPSSTTGSAVTLRLNLNLFLILLLCVCYCYIRL